MQDLKKEYKKHKIFEQLTEFANFYKSLANSTMRILTMGTNSIMNLDTDVFISIKGTLNSIKEILANGRINDSYALLRKYYDSTIINIYTNLYLDDNFNIDNLIVEKIDKWLKATESIPEYREMSQYIKKSPKLKPITEILSKNNHYKSVRERCNAHTHYKFYYHLLLNDNEILLAKRVKALDTFSSDLTAIFIQHFAYLFYLNNHYMRSTHYIECLDMNETPEEDSLYWVSPFIQETFDKWIKPYNSDIASEIKSKTVMYLE